MLTPDFDALSAANKGKLYTLPLVDGELCECVVFRKPSIHEYERVVKKSSTKDADHFTLSVRFGRELVIFPPKESLIALEEEFPGIFSKVGNEALTIAQGVASEHAKKYTAST